MSSQQPIAVDPDPTAPPLSHSAPPWAIRSRRLNKSYGTQPVLHNVCLDVAAGQLVCLLGASGCGKSTLLRLLAGLETPDPSPAESRPDKTAPPTLELRSPDPARSAAPRLGFVFQQPNLLPWRTVHDNIALPLSLQNVSRATRQTAVASALEQVGLRPSDGVKWPWMLSGGMQMRASLARALVTRPEIMLLDEPFSALDEVLRQRLGEELRQWHAAFGWTTVFVTHHVSEAVFLADRIVVFRNVAAAADPDPSRTPDGPTSRDSVAADIPIAFSHPRVEQLRERHDYIERVVQVTKVFRETQA